MEELNNALINASNYDATKGLPVGIQTCEIKGISLYKSKQGTNSLKLDFDIADGEFQGYFSKLEEKFNKWPNEGSKYLSLKDSCQIYLNKFLKSVEKYNNIKLDLENNFNIEQLIGLKFNGEFGLEEKLFNNTLSIKLSLLNFREPSYSAFPGKVFIKTTEGKVVDYNVYMENGE